MMNRVLLLILGIVLILYRFASTAHIVTPETIDFYAGTKEPITIIGFIADEPDVRRDKIYYTIDPSPITGHFLISTKKYPPYQYGDTLQVIGNLQKPPVFDAFDYAGYLSRYDIYAVMYRPKIKLLPHVPHVPHVPYVPHLQQQFFAQLLHIKSFFEQKMNLVFPTEPQSSLMAGLLMGSRKGLSEELTKDFQTTGLSHIIAVSGYNITIVVTLLMAIFRPLGKRFGVLISGLGIIFFTLFVGASASVVRACIMGLIALLALHSERKGSASIALVLTAALMIGYNPQILFHDIGFQLSFLATLGLIYLSPLLEPYAAWLPKKLAIRESLLLTISAQIMTLPLILLNFHTLSLVAPLSNLLILSVPVIPLAMLFGFVAILSSFFLLPLAKIIAFPAFLLLGYMVHVIRFTADIPFASLEIRWFPKAIFFILYISIIVLIARGWKNIHQRKMRIIRYQLQFQQMILQAAHH